MKVTVRLDVCVNVKHMLLVYVIGCHKYTPFKLLSKKTIDGILHVTVL